MNKYTDPEFDIEGDLEVKNCLEGIEYWLNDSVERDGNVNASALGDALSTLAASNILAGAPLPIDVNAAAKALDFGCWSGRSRPGSVHRIVRRFCETSARSRH